MSNWDEEHSRIELTHSETETRLAYLRNCNKSPNEKNLDGRKVKTWRVRFSKRFFYFYRGFLASHEVEQEMIILLSAWSPCNFRSVYFSSPFLVLLQQCGNDGLKDLNNRQWRRK